MTPLEERIVAHLTGRTLQRDEVAEAIGATLGGVDSAIARLVKRGLLRKINRGWAKPAQYTSKIGDACSSCATDRHTRCGTPGCICPCMLDGPFMSRPREIIDRLNA